MHNNPLFFFRLVNEKEKKYNAQRLAMHIMVGLFLLIYGMDYLPTYKENGMYIFAIFSVAITLLILPIFKKNIFHEVNQNRLFRVLEIGFLLMGTMHFLQQNKILPFALFLSLAVLLLFFLKVEIRILQEQFILFYNKEIIVEMPLKDKKIHWHELKNIVIKNNYCTFEYIDGHFSQFLIEEKDFEKEKFNAFINLQLTIQP